MPCSTLITFSRARLKSTGDRASPCFNPVSTVKVSDVTFCVLTLYFVFSIHILVRAINFFGKNIDLSNINLYPNHYLFYISNQHHFYFCVYFMFNIDSGLLDTSSTTIISYKSTQYHLTKRKKCSWYLILYLFNLVYILF